MRSPTPPRTYLISGGLLGFGLGAVVAIVLAGGGATAIRTVTAYATVHATETVAKVDTVTATQTVTTATARTTALTGGTATDATQTTGAASRSAVSSSAPDSPPSDRRHPPSGFCETHACVPRFDQGTGYVVQCDDGVWSHDGGRRQVCADDGGVRHGSG